MLQIENGSFRFFRVGDKKLRVRLGISDLVPESFGSVSVSGLTRPEPTDTHPY